jgi:hypothetical protein
MDMAQIAPAPRSKRRKKDEMSIELVQEMIFKVSFKGARKRFFTERAAYNWLAARMIDDKPRTQCECSNNAYEDWGGVNCGKHDHTDKLRIRLARYLRYIARAARAAQKGKQDDPQV